MRQLPPWLKVTITLWAAAAALLHYYYNGPRQFDWLETPEPLRFRAVHLLLFVPMAFLLYPARPSSPQHRPSVLDWIWAAASAAPHLYIYVDYISVYDRSEYLDPLTLEQQVLGIVAIVTLIEGIRRAVTPILALIVALSIGYMSITEYMPGLLASRDIPFWHIVETMFMIPIGGIYGPLTSIAATLVSMFLLFGAIVQASGTGRLFTNFGAAVAGRYAGGPAKVAVVTSGLFGMMSGSSVSNVATTGSITIPLMKRIGYPAPVAGGIEAASSVGGALMPPVMGAAAFVMSEITNIPYGDVIVAAALGALLYYYTIFMNVHFEAKRVGLSAMDPADVPSWRTVGRDAHLVVPVGVLITLLMMRFSGNFSAFMATAAMVAVAMLLPHTRLTLRTLVEALADAGRTMALLALAIAGAGMITAALTTTGLVLAFGGIVKTISGGHLGIIAILLMTTCLIMGMGVPTTPAYVITAAIGAPLLIESGVPILGAHLFIFYFAILADATPPVAVASYTAAAIAQANPMATGFNAFRFALGGFVAGYAFVFDPEIMLNAPVHRVVTIMAILLPALALIAAGIVGYLRRPLVLWARALVLLAGLFGCFGHFAPELARFGVSWVALLLPLLLPGPFSATEAAKPEAAPPAAAEAGADS